MIVVQLRKIWQLSLTCLSLASVTGICLNRHLLSISSFWIHFSEDVWLFSRFKLLPEGFWLTYGHRSCRIFSKTYWRHFARWLHFLCHLVQTIIGISRRAFCSNNVSCVHVNLYFALGILIREIIDIVCRCSDSGLKKPCFCRLIKLFGVLGSEK